jgi:ABC-type phosphate/phosphonate transport system permease subunit
MASYRTVHVLLAVAGGGAGLLLAHSAGIKSWLDAKIYLAGGVVCGFLVAVLIERIRK